MIEAVKREDRNQQRRRTGWMLYRRTCSKEDGRAASKEQVVVRTNTECLHIPEQMKA